MSDTMRSAIFESAGHMAVEDVPMPRIEQPHDAIIRVVRSCVCGSDPWPFRGINQSEDHSTNPGHEAIGIVEEAGEAITSVKPGDFVIAPFTHGCGECRACRAVRDARINPGKVFTDAFGLDRIQQAYEAMDQRRTIKSYLIVGD